MKFRATQFDLKVAAKRERLVKAKQALTSNTTVKMMRVEVTKDALLLTIKGKRARLNRTSALRLANSILKEMGEHDA